MKKKAGSHEGMGKKMRRNSAGLQLTAHFRAK
jgi:hypothetical protein